MVMITISFDPNMNIYTAECEGSILDFNESLKNLCKSLTSMAEDLDDQIKETYGN